MGQALQEGGVHPLTDGNRVGVADARDHHVSGSRRGSWVLAVSRLPGERLDGHAILPDGFGRIVGTDHNRMDHQPWG